MSRQQRTPSGWVIDLVILGITTVAALLVFDELALRNLSIDWVGFGAVVTFAAFDVFLDRVQKVWWRARHTKH